MSKKDYEKAATIAQQRHDKARGAVVQAFVELFEDDNPLFNEARFRAACVPGANVRARKVS